LITFLFATRNRHKVRELRRLLKNVPVRLITLDRFPSIPPVHEDGSTFRANAAKKGVQTSRYTILPVIAEDSGLEVRALGGRPGVRSARFALRQAQGGRTQNQIDRANVAKLLRALAHVPAGRRQARFLCVIAVAAGGRLVRVFQGVCQGSIAFAEAGKGGFGYDPVFIPDGSRKTTAQLNAARKDRISHRGQAARALARWLTTLEQPRSGRRK
jgi:XTP/dITP diphosphohydrolase